MPKIHTFLGTSAGAALAVLLAAASAAAPAQTAGSGVPSSSAPAARAASHGVRKGSAAARKSLDLHAPPLNHIYSSSDLRYILAPEEVSADSATEVRVKGARVTRVPVAPGNQLQAIPWAIFHPTQAWRIFTPLEEQ